MVDPSTLPRVADMQLNVPVLAFTVAIAAGSGLLFGLVPAVQISRDSVIDAMAAGGRGATDGMRGRPRARWSSRRSPLPSRS